MITQQSAIVTLDQQLTAHTNPTNKQVTSMPSAPSFRQSFKDHTMNMDTFTLTQVHIRKITNTMHTPMPQRGEMS